MKKTEQNFKVLTREEARQVKGGGWLSQLFAFLNDRFPNWNGPSGMGGCPPPEPDDEDDDWDD